VFDSPLEFCRYCKQYVVLDQTQRECAAEHRCQTALCPLMKYFMSEEARRATEAAIWPGADTRGKPSVNIT
jgi:hypothetical protein